MFTVSCEHLFMPASRKPKTRSTQHKATPKKKVLQSGQADIPARADIAAADTWDLSPLFNTETAWETAFEKQKHQIPSLGLWKGKLGQSATQLRDALEAGKVFDQRAEQLGEYAFLRTCEDGGSSAAMDRMERHRAAAATAAEARAYFIPELQAINDTTWQRFIVDPVLAEWKTVLWKIRRLRPHTLSGSEERLMALVAEPLAGMHAGFEQLTNVDLRFGTILDEKGSKRELTQSTYSSLLLSPSRKVRKQAFEQFYEGFSAHRHTLAALLAHSIKTDVFEARARNYPNARAAALFAHDVPEAVYDNLITTVHAHLPEFQGYCQLRAKALKLDRLHAYDSYLPLVPTVRVRISFDEACEQVLAALEPLGESYVATLRAGLLKERWCDRYENRGKHSGAFSSGSYGSPPYLLMNYKDDVFSDVFTLAHEAGHSMHTWLACKKQRHQDASYCIFIAEVASTFNEALLTEHLLAITDDPRRRAYLINRQLDDIRNTLHRQTMFAEFEKLTHERYEAGEALTLEAFQKIYRGLLNAYFGNAMAIDPQMELEALRIPHFYNAFYVYQYSTGIAAALALSEKVLREGAPARDRYLEALSLGGSRMPIDALRHAGVDMASPAPIEAALDLFSRRTEELAKLLKKIER